MSVLTEDERYVLARLDRVHVAEIADQVRGHLDVSESVEACYQPGDGTWYSLVFVPLGAVVGAAGGGTNGNAPSSYLHGATLAVLYAQRRTFVDLYPHSDIDTAAADLSDSPASALAIAELLRAILA